LKPFWWLKSFITEVKFSLPNNHGGFITRHSMSSFARDLLGFGQDSKKDLPASAPSLLKPVSARQPPDLRPLQR
jgi:hypothetical protein